jgi:hypothetical protein
MVDSQGDERSRIRLNQCPVQLQLIEPSARHYCGADVVLAAACVVHAVRDFEARLFKGKVVATACPKTDQALELYGSIIRTWCDESEIRSLTLVVMNVSCCEGLEELVRKAMNGVCRKLPVHVVVIGLDGSVKQERVMS